MVNKTTQIVVFLLIQLVIGCFASSNKMSHFDDMKIVSFVVNYWHYIAVGFNQTQLSYDHFISCKIEAF